MKKTTKHCSRSQEDSHELQLLGVKIKQYGQHFIFSTKVEIAKLLKTSNTGCPG